MILYLYGQDSYRRKQKLGELVRAYKSKNTAIDFLSVDLSEDEEVWIKARDFLSQPSIFTKKKLLVVRENGFAEEKAWSSALKKEVDSNETFVLISDAAKPKKTFTFLLKAPVKSQSFEELEGLTLDSFLKQEAEKRQLVFAPEAWQYFRRYLQKKTERSWQAVNDLDKIFLAGFPTPLSLKNLELALILPADDFSFFKVGNLFGAADKTRRIAVLEDLFLTKEDPAYIFNSLAYQSRGSVALRLADYDVSVKSGGLDYETALLDFVIGF